MKQLIESGAVRIAAGIQRFGAHVDFEVLSLPGGSVIAAVLWLCASTREPQSELARDFAWLTFRCPPPFPEAL